MTDQERDTFECTKYEVSWSVKIRNKIYSIKSETDLARVANILAQYLNIPLQNAVETLIAASDSNQWASDCDAYIALHEHLEA